MSEHENRRTVERFWTAMADNDFRAAGALLHDEFVLEWPQSGERIRGRDNFVAVNERYPAAGRWIFTVHRLIADDGGVATDVTVTDGVQSGRAVTFRVARRPDRAADRILARPLRRGGLARALGGADVIICSLRTA